MRKAFRPAALGLAGLFIAVSAPALTPALADVKAGVDAWSRGEYRKAVEEWRPAAIAGDADAQFNLGQAYKLGRGVPVDMAMAESWYRKAALQGQVGAEANYGLILFQNGERAEALPWLNKSVARGAPRPGGRSPAGVGVGAAGGPSPPTHVAGGWGPGSCGGGQVRPARRAAGPRLVNDGTRAAADRGPARRNALTGGLQGETQSFTRA